MTLTLFHAPDTGSQIVYDALVVCRAPFKLVRVDYEKSSRGEDLRLRKANPLSRLPTFVLPNREILTESGAIVLHLDALYPRAGLSPKPLSTDHARFLRLLFILTGEIYPCFTFRDDPSEWVRAKASRAPYAEAINRHRKELWIHFESLMPSRGTHREPWAMGRKFTAIDLYLKTMTQWGPGWDWFQRHTPKLARIAAHARVHVAGLESA